MNRTLLTQISLGNVRHGPPQVFGGVRLVPLLRDEVRDDLRLSCRKYNEDVAAVNISGDVDYCAYVPHAFVADWTSDGTAAFSFGSQLRKGHKKVRTSDGKVVKLGDFSARVMSKMRRREDKKRLRFLPLDLAMEGLLARHFGGPAIAWEEYSNSLLSYGLGSRTESAFDGRQIHGLDDALRMFEIHDNQSGVVVFVGDALASVFLVPNPDDYRELHGSLIKDFFGELVYIYGLSAIESVYHPGPMNSDQVNAISDLLDALKQNRAQWSDLHEVMMTKLVGCEIESELVYRMGPFSMQRFVTGLDPKGENHIGECIVREEDGEVEYLKSFRLSAAQTRRAYLLKQIAGCEWNLEECAELLNCTKNQLVLRLENSGFGYFLHQHVIDAARAELRRRKRAAKE